GTAAIGQVSLPFPAGPGGVVLTLISSQPTVAITPASVVVPAGGTSTTFPGIAFPGGSPTLVFLTIVGPGITAVATPQGGPAGGTAQDNLLVNGSFELPVVPSGADIRTLRGVDELPGWRITRGSVDVVPAPFWQPAPGEGSQSLDLVGVGAGTIEQTFATAPG